MRRSRIALAVGLPAAASGASWLATREVDRHRIRRDPEFGRRRCRTGSASSPGLRGHGRSERPRDRNYSIDAFGDDLQAVVEATLADGERASLAAIRWARWRSWPGPGATATRSSAA